jgi:two-component system NtrC family sensor kinase
MEPTGAVNEAGLELARELALAQAALRAKEKTIAALVASARRRQMDPNSSFAALFSGAALQEAVRRKTAEVAEASRRLQRMERSLADAQRLESIGRLAAGVAHEINTPTQYVGDNLGFISSGVASLLALCRRVPELVSLCESLPEGRELGRQVAQLYDAADLEFLQQELPAAVEQSVEGVERVAAIVRAMKEFSHPGTRQKAPIDLNHALESTLIVGRAEWKYVATVETSFDRELPAVLCFPCELNQVFLNMLINSAHAIFDRYGASPAKLGVIRVTTRRAGEWAEVLIEDDGCGIPEENLRRIYEPFFTTKEVGRGTGQGLSMAYAVIVNKHGGEIECRSEVGAGACFTLRLPLAPARSSVERPVREA